MKTSLRVLGAIIAIVMLTFGGLPPQEVKAAYAYPVLPAGLNYYQTTFPAGLRYSQGWYGTFTNAPKVSEVYLFDDDWTAGFGRAIFAVPPAPNKQPSGAQGGTTLTSITRDEANTILQSYNTDLALKPFDTEIEAVMLPDHYFVGAWMGEKLRQKWNYGKAGRSPPDNLTGRQKDYIKDTYGKAVKQVDLILYDPDRFWVNNSGNWSDNTNHWANASGNTSAGASIPTSADNVLFDASSFTLASQVVTANSTANMLSMSWTGATGSPTMADSRTSPIHFL